MRSADEEFSLGNPEWEEGMWAAYQVRMDDGTMIWAPNDNNTCVRELARDFRGLEVGVDVVGVLELAAGAVAVPLGALRGDDADEGEEHEGPKEGARGTGTHRPCSSSNEEFRGSGGRFLQFFLERVRSNRKRDVFNRVGQDEMKNR